MLIVLWPRRSLPLPTMIFSMHLIVISFTCFKFSYMKEVAIWNDLCVNKCDASCPYFCLLTLHSINLWSCLLSSAFAWRQARSKLGGVDTSILHHYFYIIIYCYLLIFIILGYNTYVILPVLHVWWLLENKSPERGFSWKKLRQDTNFTKILFW